MPTKILRYKRERKIDTKRAEFELHPAQQSFSRGVLPQGWEEITHPEGQPYFYHKEKRIITENWIWDADEIRVLDGFIKEIESFTRSRNLYQSDDTHLILECLLEDEKWWCGYYYACASTRSLFWLEKYDISRFLDEIHGEIDPMHIKLYLEYEYWCHWDLFPNVTNATSEMFDLVSNTIADARTDVLTSKQTTVNHSMEDLKEMADIVECASKRKNRASSWCLGRFMKLFVRDQVLNFHGQYGARLSRSQSIYRGSREYQRHTRTWFIKVLSPLLFSSANVHLAALEELWVDRLTLKARCVEFFAKLNTEWGEHIVHASILLNANVAFLAIPSNDASNNTSPIQPLRYPAQIASYVSVVTSFASMMIGLLLVRQHKQKVRATVTVGEFSTYLRERARPVRGFEQLACIYSLPYALLTWA
ncbi:putative expressed protein [Lyophyllum shimeji]|uniref:Expressed protein n=1 Tax=Lyophyllum shimeji TaxID=47721 RepID=A0A9P3PTA5_LYOSH|nr:putative expressed protein [Lyophyllum shimeji]